MDGQEVTDWQKRSEKYYTNVDADKPKTLSFLENNPRVAPFKDKFKGESVLYFKVMDEGGYERGLIARDSLCRALTAHAPLGGKTLVISRFGLGYDTRYEAEAAPPKQTQASLK